MNFAQSIARHILQVLLLATLTSAAFADNSSIVPVGTEPPDGYTGVWTTWFDNGNKASERSYNRGTPDGICRYWYPSGQIQLEGSGSNQGPSKWTWWYSNGLRSAEATYLNGNPHGTHVKWDKDGRIISGTRYEDGEITFLEHYENGVLINVEPAPTYDQHAARVAEKTSSITNGMTRGEVEKILPNQDGGLQGPSTMRYYEGWEVMVEVPFDQTGGPWKPENHVNGTVRIYRGFPASD